MIRLEFLPPGSQLARVSPPGSAGDMPEVSAVFCLHWDMADPRALWIKGFKGSMTRQGLRVLLTKLVDLQVHTVLAIRADGHVLPLGVVGPDGVTRISVQQLVDRFAKPGASDWSGLG